MYNGCGKEKNNKNKNKTRLITKSDLITFKNAEVSFPKSNRKHLESNFWFWIKASAVSGFRDSSVELRYCHA